MNTLTALLPIFAVIALGYAGGRGGFFPTQFTAPANRLVYYVAVPALVFKAMAGAPLQASFQPMAAFSASAALALAWAGALLLSRLLSSERAPSRPLLASLQHTSIHGNITIMGLAVIYYSQGEEGVGAAGFIVTCLVVMQNALGIISLTRWGQGQSKEASSLYKSMFLNPIILATLAGLGVAVAGVQLPQPLDRTLVILGNMGLPLALLLVGAAMSRSSLAGNWWLLLGGQGLKLLVLPGLGWLLLFVAGVPSLPLTSAVILLAAPTATISVIMAGEMGGDSAFTSQAVSLSHALSAATYFFWLWLLFPAPGL